MRLMLTLTLTLTLTLALALALALALTLTLALALALSPAHQVDALYAREVAQASRRVQAGLRIHLRAVPLRVLALGLL